MAPDVSMVVAAVEVIECCIEVPNSARMACTTRRWDENFHHAAACVLRGIRYESPDEE